MDSLGLSKRFASAMYSESATERAKRREEVDSLGCWTTPRRSGSLAALASRAATGL